MYTRYHHTGYLAQYHTPTKIPATAPQPEPVSKFHTIHENGVEYFESSSLPVIQDLEELRTKFQNSSITPETYLTQVSGLFADLDTPFHRRASALMRYLPLEVLGNIYSHHEASTVFNKFGCYYQAHDWASLLKVLNNEKEYLLTQQNTWEYYNDENQYYTDHRLVPTPDSDRKPAMGSLSTEQTPVAKRKRSRQPTPEVQVCPSLANL